jgi:hypothetical protein
MLETTYTLRLSQLLKITLDFKKYMWHKLKLEKPYIIIKVHSYDILGAGMLWKPREAPILMNFNEF